MRALKTLWIFLALVTAVAKAMSIEDLARIHTEAIGGRERLERLQGLRASGRVMTGGRELPFTLIAARPNRVRVTMEAEGRTLIQGMDGEHAPWRLEPQKSSSGRAMEPAEAAEFAADAEFDDPLSSGAARGYTLDYAGETGWQQRKVLKILVTRPRTDPSYLLLDPDTFFIVARLTTQRLPTGREIAVETRYDDFRPVAGVIFPHWIGVYEDGRLLRETVLTNVQTISEPAPEVFAMPLITVPR